MNIGNGNNPNSFPVKGSPAGDRSYWTGMTLYVSGTFCGPSGCRMTDKFTTYLTITPSAATSMVCWTKSIYLPNGGNFGNKHLYLWPINSSIIIGGTNTGDISTPSCKYVANTIMVNNDVLTIAVTLWVYGIPNGGYQPDGAKTANARCRPPGNNRCYY
jgi:hypothetical protein